MIEIKNFTKSYDLPVLKNFSLTVDSGQTVAVIGPSGCGKTTLLRHIARLEDASTGDVSGTIRLDAFDLLSMTESELRRHQIRGKIVGLVFQSNALFDFMTVRENILWAAVETKHLSGAEAEERLKDVCSVVKIDPSPSFLDRPVDRLSGGEKKRVALARALILDPKVILFDEATANLDPVNAANISILLQGLKSRSITSILATHDMSLARMVADRVAMISMGEKIFDGTYDQALQDPEIRRFMEGLKG